MGIYLNPGNDGFWQAVHSPIYVDKSSLLEYTNSVLDTENSRLCISRPRRFGKSITAEMLAAYYGKGCDSKELFHDLRISKNEEFIEHLNKYNVIYADMNSFLHRIDRETGEYCTPKRAVEVFQQLIIQELYQTFPECVDTDELDLPSALSSINAQTGNRFIIIIDEWDAVFREDRLNEAAQKYYITLLRGLFKDAASKRFLKLAYLTGILPIKKYGTESALNNFKEYTMVNPGKLAEYVGFTENEVKDLCKRYNVDFQQTKQWYDGYSFNKIKHIYNPNSVVNAMLEEEFSSYWSQTETYESLCSYISANFDGLKDSIIQMLGGRSCKINPQRFKNDMVSFRSRDDILTLLIHLGYLSYNSNTKEAFIPNAEVKGEFITAIEDAGWDTVVHAIEASEELLKATLRGGESKVAESINTVHQENTSVFAYNDENSLSCVITLAYYYAMNDYTLIREFPSEKGFADIVFLPRRHTDKPAMVVELKWDKDAESAIAQIEERQYVQSLQEYKGKVLLVGINYDRKKKEHSCRIKHVDK